MDDHSPGAERLKQWREDAARSQTSVAADLDIRQNTVCEWEKGSRRPDITNALRLEHVSGGRVPATAWGYSSEECGRVLAAMATVAHGRGITSDIGTAPILPPEVA